MGTESIEAAVFHIKVVPDFVASDEFDRVARLFGYEKERTCKGCEHEGLASNVCAYCNRHPSLDDRFVKAVG